MYKNVMLIGFLLFLLVPITAQESTLTKENEYISLSLGDGTENPYLGNPILDNEYPNTEDDVTVSFPFYDADGLDIANLYWTYTTTSESINTTMELNENVQIVNEIYYRMENTTFLNSYGEKVEHETNWIRGEYAFVGLISSIELRIASDDSDSGVNKIVKYRIETKNITTGEWEVQADEGGLCCGISDLGDPSFDFKDIAGIRVLAVSYHDTVKYVNKPWLRYLFIEQDHLVGIIPSIDLATEVHYHARVFDTTGKTVQSAEYKFILDDAPVVSFNNFPTKVGVKQQLTVNVTVQDADDINDIAQVILYFKLLDENIWKSINLIQQVKLDEISAIYTKSISLIDLKPYRTGLEIVVNATDMVNGKLARTSSISGQVEIDAEIPEVYTINFDSRTPLANVSNANSDVYIGATFVDNSGIRSAAISYRFNGTEYTLDMYNSTDIDSNQEDFWVIIPAIHHSTMVEYWFVLSDMLDNTGNSATYSFYADGMAPTIKRSLVFPKYVSNTSEAHILFDVIDDTELQNSKVWYSIGDEWDAIDAEEIDYSPIVVESYSLNDYYSLPMLINDSATNTFDLHVNRSNPKAFQQAILMLTINHESSSDLRIWIIIDQVEYLIFTRELHQGIFSITIDLLEFGINPSKFEEMDISIKIIDYSDVYSGSLISCILELIDYNLPYGYEFQVIIPAVHIDTDVIYFIESRDVFDYTIRSNNFSYYADGLAPSIDVINGQDMIDLEGDNYVKIEANITDNGGVKFAEVYYHYENADSWIALDLTLDVDLGIYYAMLPIASETGNISYYYQVIDYVDYFTRTEILSVQYTNGMGPIITILNHPDDVVNLDNKSSYTVQALIVDNGEVKTATISYSFNDSSGYYSAEMLADKDEYSFSIEVPEGAGTIIFYITAVDNKGLIQRSDLFSLQYVNAGFQLDPMQIGALSGGFVLLFIIAGLIYKKMRKGKVMVKKPGNF
ncbi:MAG: hypothetical protein INQ03_16305 [Candidatus Heimdallarchaeota archaeon]|nr:hypothetical protein [Candidatus Heimdallarchaeota archaeon]